MLFERHFPEHDDAQDIGPARIVSGPRRASIVGSVSAISAAPVSSKLPVTRPLQKTIGVDGRIPTFQQLNAAFHASQPDLAAFGWRRGELGDGFAVAGDDNLFAFSTARMSSGKRFLASAMETSMA